VGPPGLDLAQGLASGVEGCSKTVIEGIVRDYYSELCLYVRLAHSNVHRRKERGLLCGRT
jgi:hypothetical protein